MKERKSITILKSADPEELLVVHAGSTKDQIRFYLNETQYVSASENDNGEISVDIGEEVEEKNEKSKLTLFKENFKEIFLFSAIFILAGIVAAMLGIYISNLMNNVFIGVFFIFIMFYSVRLVNVIFMEVRTVSATIKSKHSAEHMMVNFLEANKRLPKDMAEIKSASRFSKKCGSRKKVESIVQDFVKTMLAIMIAIIADIVFSLLIDNSILESIVVLAIYYLAMYLADVMIKKHEQMTFVINPIKNVLNNLVQCVNTTKKAEDKDILLAYYSARGWMALVYPEFYNKKEDVFLDNYSKS